MTRWQECQHSGSPGRRKHQPIREWDELGVWGVENVSGHSLFHHSMLTCLVHLHLCCIAFSFTISDFLPPPSPFVILPSVSLSLIPSLPPPSPFVILPSVSLSLIPSPAPPSPFVILPSVSLSLIPPLPPPSFFLLCVHAPVWPNSVFMFVCRLYSSAVFKNNFEEHAAAEITRRPVDDLVLQMKVSGGVHADRSLWWSLVLSAS